MAIFFLSRNGFNYPWNSWIYKRNVDLKNMDINIKCIKIVEIDGIINSSWTSVIYFASFMDKIGLELFEIFQRMKKRKSFEN